MILQKEYGFTVESEVFGGDMICAVVCFVEWRNCDRHFSSTEMDVSSIAKPI
jgi:hypothetical protein